ncbi:MAG: ABC transporter ATP-binding protein [Candidatus Aminicenantes bacterium]|nr:ABC transporter ATP-binding protein [Candidatus Aminicenantes bacterium]MCJ7486187.1 ABC transporter ATP-binding protein [Candidatus Aminicenantes bacterium]TFG52780.1 MAG: ABC transporter ATP-binding protein [Candidatus Aminicenantes bacterium]
MIELQGITKVYRTGSQVLEALRSVSLTIARGEFISIMGPSGSGKSTLMNIVGCLDTPTAGEYVLDGDNVAGLTFDQLASVRNRKIGFVFQNFNLLPYATAWENIELPMLFDGKNGRKRRERVTELLNAVGLYEWRDHRPSELSGGQQQRIALARALANDPPILLADEPTGNLDSRSGEEIMAILTELWRGGRTIVMVTHNDHIAAHSQRTIRLFDGQVRP